MHAMTKTLLLIVAAVSCLGVDAPVTAAERPNIVLFVVDDLGVHDTAVGGSPYYLTPNIDRLAAEGMTFTQAYATHPRCTPSRYGLFSGVFPARAGVPGSSYTLEDERVTMAEVMADAGYDTWFVGKWHLADKDDGNMPEDQGFRVNIAGGHAGAPGSYEWPYDKKKNKNHKTEKDITGLEDGEPGKMLTDHLTEKTETLLRAHAAGSGEKPFFLALCHYGVHTPFEDTDDRVKMFRKHLRTIGTPEGPAFAERDGTEKLHHDNPVYAAMTYRVDESLGRVQAVLDELGMADNTVIVFTSDHGGLSNRGFDNQRKLATSNRPLRAGKGHLFEGGIRVPFIVKWPGHVAAGSTSDAVTTNTDPFATFAELAGHELADDVAPDGVSLVPALTGGEQEERGPIYWHSPLARPQSTGDHNATAVREGDWKLIHWHDADRDELFNLATDAPESTDVSGENPEIAERLRAGLDAWLKDIDAVESKNRKKKSGRKGSDDEDDDENEDG